MEKLAMYLTHGDRIIVPGYGSAHVYATRVHNNNHVHLFLDDGGFEITARIYDVVLLDE